MFTLTLVLFFSSFIYFLFSIYKLKILKKKIEKIYFNIFSADSLETFKSKQKELIKHNCEKSKKFNIINILNKIFFVILFVFIVIIILYRENEISLFLMSIGLFLASGFLFLLKESCKELYYIYSSNKPHLLITEDSELDEVYTHQQANFKHCICSTLLLSITTFMAHIYN